MKLRGRTDANQGEIVRDLRKVGAQVKVISAIGGGLPDLLVGFRNLNFLLEVKDPSQPPSKRKLTDDERVFHAIWSGQVAIVETFEEALKVISQ